MYLSKNYKRLPVCFTHGKGAYLYDKQKNPYLDLLSGISVCNLGHAHPKISEVIATQAARLMHVSNLYHIEPQEQLAEVLCIMTGLKGAFFCNSGTEANETAFKIIRLHAHQKGIKNPKIIVFENAFHGRTTAMLAASDNALGQKGFEPLVPDFIRLPVNNVEILKQVFESSSEICGLFFEAVQGEGGINILNDNFLQEIQRMCQQHDCLMVADEIQCGMGRTGTWLAYESANIQPDIVTLAKGLGNGMPIGACLMSDYATSLLGPGKHGSTFGGNPLACKVALEVIRIMKEENLLGTVNHLSSIVSDFFINQPSEMKLTLRIKGLMIGIESDDFEPMMVTECLEDYRLLVNIAKSKVLRLLPPFIIKEQCLRKGLLSIEQMIKGKINK